MRGWSMLTLRLIKNCSTLFLNKLFYRNPSRNWRLGISRTVVSSFFSCFFLFGQKFMLMHVSPGWFEEAWTWLRCSSEGNCWPSETGYEQTINIYDDQLVICKVMVISYLYSTRLISRARANFKNDIFYFIQYREIIKYIFHEYL